MRQPSGGAAGGPRFGSASASAKAEGPPLPLLTGGSGSSGGSSGGSDAAPTRRGRATHKWRMPWFLCSTRSVLHSCSASGTVVSTVVMTGLRGMKSGAYSSLGATLSSTCAFSSPKSTWWPNCRRNFTYWCATSMVGARARRRPIQGLVVGKNR